MMMSRICKKLLFLSVIRWILTKRNRVLKFIKSSSYVLSSTHPVFHFPSVAGVRNLIPPYSFLRQSKLKPIMAALNTFILRRPTYVTE